MPVIAQLVELNTRPAGSVALIVQLTMAVPRAQVNKLASTVVAAAGAMAGAVELVLVELVELVAVVFVAGAGAVAVLGAVLVMVVAEPSVKFRLLMLYAQSAGGRSVVARFR